MQNQWEVASWSTSLNPVPNAQVCVYLTVHITKLQLQTTFSKPLYIPHFTCIHWDPGHWKSSCLHCLWPGSALICSCMSSGIVWRIYVGFVADIDIKILKVRPLGSGMPFLDSDTCAEGGGVIYLCQGFFPCMMPSMDGWWDGCMDESHDEKSFMKNNDNIFYYM